MATIAEYLTALGTSLKARLDAINLTLKAKGQSEASSLDAVPALIEAISTGIDTSDADATSSDIRSGKTAYVKGSKVTGGLAEVTQATPTVSINASGLITASATQSAGIVASGTKSGTKQLTTKSADTITPGTTDQTIAAGTYLTGALTIKAKNGFLSNSTVGSTHSDTLTLEVEGLNGRYPKHIALYSNSLTGDMHDDEDICTAVMCAVLNTEDDGSTYGGMCRENGSSASTMCDGFTVSFPTSSNQNSMQLKTTSCTFYGSYIALIVC